MTAVFLLAIALWSQRKRIFGWRARRQAVGVGHRGAVPVFRIYQSTVARLAAQGLPRLPWETPHEYLARVRRSPLEGATVFEDLTQAYTSARYGDIEIPAETVSRLRRESHAIGLPG